MVNSNSTHKLANLKKIALLALASNAASPTGRRPDLLEIDLFRRHKLRGKRQAEVKAFIARDSECYQMWRDLIEAEAELNDLSQQPATDRVTFWQKVIDFFHFDFSISSGGLVVAASILVLVIGYRQFMLTPSIIAGIDRDYQHFQGHPLAADWSYKTFDKSLNFNLPSRYDKVKKSVLVGMRKGLDALYQRGAIDDDWLPIIERYPKELNICEDASDQVCQKRQQSLQELGYWLTLSRVNCTQTDSSRSQDYLSTQQQRLDFFYKTFSDDTLLQPLIARMDSLPRLADEHGFCEQVMLLLNEFDD